MDAGGPKLPEAVKVDVKETEARSDDPDVREGDAGKLTAPAESQGDGTDDGH